MKLPAGLDDERVYALLILFAAKVEIRSFQYWWRVTIFPQLATCLDRKLRCPYHHIRVKNIPKIKIHILLKSCGHDTKPWP